MEKTKYVFAIIGFIYILVLIGKNLYEMCLGIFYTTGAESMTYFLLTIFCSVATIFFFKEALIGKKE